MAKKFYNPDIIERQTVPEGDKSVKDKKDEKTRKEDTRVNESPGLFQKVSSFFHNRRTRIFVGAVLAVFGVYLLIVFISYLQNGSADQSVVMSGRAMSGAKVGNAGAAVGASMAEAFINRGIGLAAFIVVAWCMVIGIRMVRLAAKVRFVRFTSMTLVNIVACVMVLGCVSLFYNPSAFLLGGNVGYYANSSLRDFTGIPGMILVNVLIIVLWALVCYKPLQSVYSMIAKHMPKRTKFEDEEETVDDDRNVGAGSENADGTSDAGEPCEKNPFETAVEKPEPVKPEAAASCEVATETQPVEKPDGGDMLLEEVGEAEPVDGKTCGFGQQPQGVQEQQEIEGSIIVSAPIEQGNENRFEAYDPTKELSKYVMPPLDLLREGDAKQHTADLDEQEENKKRITETLAHYDIQIKKIDVCVGPTISLFEIQPCDGVRISKIKGLGNDIQMSLAALGIRIIAPIPGKCTIGIEVPNKDPQTVYMRSILGSAKFQNCKMELPMALGCTITNDVAVADLTKMPHLLVAGATGQGKSVGLNAIIASLLYKKHPSELKLVLIDPKTVEFSLYSKLEHHYLAKLAGEDECIVIDSKKAIATLNSLVQEMENRNMLLRDAGERNIKDYNAKFVARRLNPEKGHRFMPYIVLVIDEYADLVMTGGKDVERPVARIAQKARAVGIHMIIATQRPSTDVITGMIKANFPGRIAFKVVQMVDSRTILDCPGAEQLVGRGDMLFSAAGSVVERIQCAFIDTPEVESICNYISSQVGYDEAYELPEYIPDPDEQGGESGGGSMNISDRDPLFDEIAQYIVMSDTASTSSLQRHYNIGYNRAGRIMDQMEAAGIVGPSQGGKPRKVLVDSVQLQSIISQ